MLVLSALTAGEGKVIDSINDIEAVDIEQFMVEKIRKFCLITPEVIETMKRLSPLAPLHNPANILGIEICQELMHGKPNVGYLILHSTKQYLIMLICIHFHMKCIQNMELEIWFPWNKPHYFVSK